MQLQRRAARNNGTICCPAQRRAILNIQYSGAHGCRAGISVHAAQDQRAGARLHQRAASTEFANHSADRHRIGGIVRPGLVRVQRDIGADGQPGRARVYVDAAVADGEGKAAAGNANTVSIGRAGSKNGKTVDREILT